MDDEPAKSVIDPLRRVHSHDNRFIADGSLYAINAGFNPVETIMALAWLAAECITIDW